MIKTAILCVYVNVYVCVRVCVREREREMTYIAGRILSESCSILFEETISPGAELARLRK